MNLIVYGDRNDPVYRKTWRLPDLSSSEFDVNIHCGKHFIYPDNLPIPQLNSMYMWKHVVPENESEEAELIKLGKSTSNYKPFEK